LLICLPLTVIIVSSRVTALCILC